MRLRALEYTADLFRAVVGLRPMRPRALGHFAGVVWVAVGLMLGWRGGVMLQDPSVTTVGLALGLGFGLVIGVLKGRYVLARTARRNLKRFHGLSHPRPWNVFTLRFVLLIGLMIGVGRGLRALADHGVIPWALVGGIYVGIGAGLAVASLVYFVSPPPPLPTRSDVAPTLATRGGPIGVLISNLGTPDAPTTPAVRRYLREFLSDERVVEVNRWLWAFVLNVIILPRRAAASARAYSVVWDEKTGSPLLHWSRQTSTALARELGDDYVVSLGMRYGAPSLETALEELVTARCRTIIVLPLYPQYSNPTTGTNNAKVMELVMARREQPTVSFVPPYPDDALYVAALADRVHEAMGDRPPDHYVFSFHGLPEAYVRASDPYVEQCACTAWALASALELERDQWEMVFQSRFGDEPWLQPFLDEYVPELASSTPRILVTMPGFAADCLETLEEVGVRLRERFAAAGGEELIVVPALNDHPVWIESLAGLVRETRAQHAYR